MSQYTGQLKADAEAVWLAQLIDAHLERDEGMTARFGSLTTEHDVSQTIWENNLRKIESFMDRVTGSGIWSLERTEAGCIHAHYLFVLPISKLPNWELLLSHWEQVLGFVDDQEAHDLFKVVRYVNKPQEGTQVKKLQYVGDSFVSQPEPDQPEFEGGV